MSARLDVGMTITRRITAGLTAAVAAGAALGAAGCGGGGGGGADNASARPDDAKQLALARCMRKAGIDFPDPKPGPAGAPAELRIPRSISPERFMKMERDCRRSSGIAIKAPTAAEQARFRDDALKFARCMRAHGIDLPDPQIRPGGGVIIQHKDSGSGGGASSPDFNSPAFRRAQAACPSSLAGRKFSAVGKAGAPAKP
jgi:hypothetical protein